MTRRNRHRRDPPRSRTEPSSRPTNYYLELYEESRWIFRRMQNHDDDEVLRWLGFTDFNLVHTLRETTSNPYMISDGTLTWGHRLGVVSVRHENPDPAIWPYQGVSLGKVHGLMQSYHWSPGQMFWGSEGKFMNYNYQRSSYAFNHRFRDSMESFMKETRRTNANAARADAALASAVASQSESGRGTRRRRGGRESSSEGAITSTTTSASAGTISSSSSGAIDPSIRPTFTRNPSDANADPYWDMCARNGQTAEPRYILQKRLLNECLGKWGDDTDATETALRIYGRVDTTRLEEYEQLRALCVGALHLTQTVQATDEVKDWDIALGIPGRIARGEQVGTGEEW